MEQGKKAWVAAVRVAALLVIVYVAASLFRYQFFIGRTDQVIPSVVRCDRWTGACAIAGGPGRSWVVVAQ